MNTVATKPSHTMERAAVSWRVSSRSGGGSNGSNCVEVGALHLDAVGVRDTKYREGGVLSADPAEWQSLLTAVKHGTLDR